MDFLPGVMIIALIAILIIGIVGGSRQSSDFTSSQIDNSEDDTAPRAFSSVQKDENSSHKQSERPRVDAISSSQKQAADIFQQYDEFKKKYNVHEYFAWSWVTMSYTRGMLSVTYPLGWEGLSDDYSIAWFQTMASPITRPVGASLSWARTPYSVSDVLRSRVLYEKVSQELKVVASNYFRWVDTSHMSSTDMLLDALGDRDVATRLVISGRYEFGYEAGRKLLDDHYMHSQDIDVQVFPHIPFDGTSIGEELINFPKESTICLEASGRGLRYLLYYFDKSPSCVFQLHLIRLVDIEFDQFDACMAAYIIRNLHLNSRMLQSGQFEESQTIGTLAAEWHNLAERVSAPTIALSHIDGMSGLEFEQFVGRLLRSRGFDVEVTKGSGDYGIDVIAKKQGVAYGIQVKRHTGRISRNAVSDAVAGKMYYHCDHAMVITNSYFHDSAIVLAHSTTCELVDRDTLQEWVIESEF